MKLRAMLLVRFTVLVIAVVFVTSIASDFMIRSRFEGYMTRRQKLQADEIARNISRQYDAESQGWNIDYIHGMGMYALNDGYIIRLQDKNDNILWDAENHDMTLCHDIMQSISVLMNKARPDLQGDFLTHRYELPYGYLDISYYGPYYIRDNDFQFMEALNYVLVAVGMIALAAAVVISVMLADKISGPVAEAVNITRRIAGGDYSIRLSHEGSVEELHALVQSVNHMAKSLEEQDILRRRLTSDVAHELRTPLTNLSSCLEMMIEGVWHATTERLESCYGEIHRLSAIISDLEQLRQAEDGNLTLNITRTDLLELSKSAVNSFMSCFQERGIICTVEGKNTEAFVDSGRIRQVITNLLSNAIKYSWQGGRVRVMVSEMHENSIITVEDDGIGIPEQDLGRIFERFYRTDRSRTRKTGGAGIGLAIARAIVKAHGGSITAQSKKERGSIFTIALPKRGE